MPIENEAGDVSPGILKLRQTLSKFDTEVGRRKALDFKADPEDIFVVTSSKAGTTWVQQIVQQAWNPGRSL